MALTAFAEAVRTRPGMYVGDTGTLGLAHLAFQALHGPAAEAAAGRCRRVDVLVGKEDSLTVIDDGPPIPPERLEMLLREWSRAELAAGLVTERNDLMVVQALCAEFSIETGAAGTCGRLVTKEGEAQGAVSIEPGDWEGTRVFLRPDRSIFVEAGSLDVKGLARRLRDVASLCRGMEATLSAPRRRQKRWCYPDGLVDRLLEDARGRPSIPPAPISVEGKWKSVEIRGAVHWLGAKQSRVESFANSVPTEKGDHKSGFEDGVALGLQRLTPEAEGLAPAAVSRGLRGVVAVSMPHTELHFQGPTRQILAVEGLRAGIEEVVAQSVTDQLAASPQEARALLNWLAHRPR